MAADRKRRFIYDAKAYSKKTHYPRILVPRRRMFHIHFNAATRHGREYFDRFSTIMKDIYGELVGISTIVGVTAAAVALLVRMISRNQRAVDEASSWLRRILVAWILLNTLGFAVAYLQPLIAGGNYTP